MSTHSCNDLCDIDDEFHSIQKYEDEWMDEDQMKDYLMKKVQKYMALIEKIT